MRKPIAVILMPLTCTVLIAHANGTSLKAVAPSHVSIPAVVAPVGCSACAEKATLDQHRKEEARLKDLLVRNKVALEKTAKQESVYQKLASNILTLNIMIDTVTIKINDIFNRCPSCKGGA